MNPTRETIRAAIIAELRRQHEQGDITLHDIHMGFAWIGCVGEDCTPEKINIDALADVILGAVG